MADCSDVLLKELGSKGGQIVKLRIALPGSSHFSRAMYEEDPGDEVAYKLHFLEPLIGRPIMRLFQHHVTIRTQYASRALYSIFSPSCSPKQGWKYVLNAFCRFKTLNLSFIPSVLSNIFKKQYTEKKWIQI